MTKLASREIPESLLHRTTITASSLVLMTPWMARLVPYLRYIVVSGTKPR